METGPLENLAAGPGKAQFPCLGAGGFPKFPGAKIPGAPIGGLKLEPLS